MRAILAFLAGLALALAPGNSIAKDGKLPKQVERLLAMTPTDHANLVTLTDDGMETVAKLDTQRSFQEKQGLLGIVWSDIFLRAFVNKTSGNVSFQVYYVFRGTASTWPHLHAANYETPEGLASTDLERLGSDVDCSSKGLYGQCTYTEVVAFSPSEQIIRKIADTYQPADRRVWRIRFKGQSGIDADQGITPAEVQGLIVKVDQYRRDHGLNATSGSATQPSN